MANSALSTSPFQAKISNIQNAYDSSFVYSGGVYTLKNSSGTTTFTISDAGAVTAGTTTTLSPIVAATTTRGYNYITSNATFSGSLAHPPGTGHMLVMANARWNTNGSDSVVGVGAGGTSSTCLQLSDDGSVYFRSRATSSTTPDTFANYFSTTMGSCTQAGAWTLGPASGTTNTQHTMWQYGNGVAIVCEFKRVAADASTIKLTGSTNNIQIGHSGGQGYFEGISGKNAGAGAGTVYCSTGHLLGTLATSDERLKTNIRDIGSTLLGLNTLRTARFDWKDGSGTDTIGFIAQDLQKTFPDFVHEQDDGLLAIKNINSFEVVLVKAIQELSAQVTALQAESASLRDELAALKANLP